MKTTPKILTWAARLALLLALLAASAPAGATAQAQNERPPANKGPSVWHPEALKAIDLLKSPYCPGFMLEVCPSPNAAALRDSIGMLAEGGMSADSIVVWMLGRHGEEWRALPQTTGTSLIAWIVPPLAAILGIATVVLVLHRLRGPSDGPLADEVSDAERARLDAALHELEAEEETSF